MKYLLLSLLLIPIHSFNVNVNITADSIVGKWMSKDKNVEVEVYNAGKEYKASIIWFDDSDNKNIPMAVRCDTKNSNEGERTRKIIGSEVMNGLIFNNTDNEWQDGKIYDASTGNVYNARAWITNDGCLKVRGFWHVEVLGRNMIFKKVL